MNTDTIGVVVGIVGIVVAVLFHIDGDCNEVSRDKFRLESTVDSLDTQIQSLEQREEDLRNQIEYELSIISNLKEFRRDNSNYMRKLEIYEKMGEAIQMAMSAIEKIGGPDLSISERDLPRWRGILEDVGFKLNEPMTDIMLELSESSIDPSLTTQELLGTPSDADDFITAMEEWRSKANKEAAKFFFDLFNSFGENHPKAGQELREYLESEITSRQERTNDRQSSYELNNLELHKIRAEYSRNKKTIYDDMIIPNYCIIAEIIGL